MLRPPFWLILASGGLAGTVAHAGDMAAQCTALEGGRYVGGYAYARVPDAPTYIVAARMVQGTAALPEFCDVRGYIAPHVVFALRMPTQQWNGKLLMTGCGEGFCGTVDADSPESLEALRRGYAVTTNDSGHRGTSRDGKWGYNSPQAKLDFAFRSTHVNAVVGKRIVADFYGKAAARAYFQGCSTGGRHGMMSAQLFPNDFDGIIAGSPPLNVTSDGFATLWSGLANLDANGKQILDQRDAELLHKSAVTACDDIDGLKDGVIGDPRQCKFDPAVLQCKASQGGACLTAAQVDAARKIYAGPVDSKGRAIHLGAPLPGSELGWQGRFIATPEQPASNVVAMTDWFRYLVYPVDPGPSWKVSDMDWDNDPNTAGGLGGIYSASTPDLREFKARGGKLIHYHGWQDAAASPLESVDYFELAARTMGGVAATQSFYRLFMVPGMGHCASGPDSVALDYLSALENWVERGAAPDGLIGKRAANADQNVTRPHFPYPDTTRYQGSGDRNDAASFKRVIGDKSFAPNTPYQSPVAPLR